MDIEITGRSKPMKANLLSIRDILFIPSMYRLFTDIIASAKYYSTITSEFIKPKKGDRVLDIGCGVCRILDFLPFVEYLGVDISQRYIKAAIKKYSNRGTFICGNISNELFKGFSGYDIVLALGIVHHLDNCQANQLFEIAKKALKPKGRLITLDGCYVTGQSPFTRYLLSKDRGNYVRTIDEYLAMASKPFASVKEHHRNNLISIPYNHIILECTA